jgi:hypothetical protein
MAATVKNGIFWNVMSFPSNQHEASSNTKQLCLTLLDLSLSWRPP